MIRSNCPVCKKAIAFETLADLPAFPFCSERCRLIDTARWADGSYAVPDRPGADDDEIESEERPAGADADADPDGEF